jgi:MFS family permease
MPADRIDPEYRRLRIQVFAGIFLGYAAFYLVRKNFALAMPDILKEYPHYSKAALGSAMTGLSIAYGVSKFIMGSVSDRSNPRWFMTLGLLLTAGVTFAFGTFPAIYGSLTAIVVLQTLNGWFNGMGWPPCGKTMVHWWSTKERGVTVSIWNVAHNVGGGLVAKLALLGVLLFHDWGAKFYFPPSWRPWCRDSDRLAVARHPAELRTAADRGVPNDYPADYSAAHEQTLTFKEIFFGYVLNNKFLWAIAVANAFVYFVRYGVVDWIPTYLQTAKGFSFSNRARLGGLRVCRHSRDDPVRLDVGQGFQRPARARRRSCSWRSPCSARRLRPEPQRPAVDRHDRAHRDRLLRLRSDHDHRPPRARPRAEKGRGHRGRFHRLLSAMCLARRSPAPASAGSPTTGAGAASSAP